MISFRQRFPILESIYLTGGEYLILRGDQVAADDARAAEVVAICNEPLVYEWLFRERCRGEPYAAGQAVDWLLWMKDGWESNSHFGFVVADPQGRITAACDIKSADPEGAEVGYWASANHRGIMTNVVNEIIHCAWEAGYRSLKAGARHGNLRSRSVLQRAGFIMDSAARDDQRDFFSIRQPLG